jgi:uncharacterized protein YgfB (UPF0149 family)
MCNFEELSGDLYETLEEKLAEEECQVSASELQGAIAGMVSTGLQPDDPHWSCNLLAAINDSQSFSDSSQDILQKVLLETHNSFAQQDSLAPLLLPNEDYPLIDRLESLGLWCQGYLLGFGLQSGQQKISNAEIAEAISDISEISQLEVDSNDSEDAQMALITLVEHIKVAVKVIYLELVQKQQLSKASSGTQADQY